MKLKTCQNYSLYAYLLMTYVLGSLYYLVVTQSYGTPFKDAINTHPDLMKIKKNSAQKRRHAFLTGLLVSIVFLMILRPYGNIF